MSTALDSNLQRCHGMRLFLDGHCDHQKKHNKDWLRVLNDNGVEAGILNHISLTQAEVTVVWDCGATVVYGDTQWHKLRVLDCAAAGYHAPGIICDHCQQPLFGFSFRCINKSCTKSVSIVYDLCFKDYCDDKHLMRDHPFNWIIPTQFNTTHGGWTLPSREISKSCKKKVYGIFDGASVTPIGQSGPYGKVARIVHENGFDDTVKAKYWNSVAEVDWNPESDDRNKELEYCLAGQKGNVDIEAVTPSSDGLSVYTSHFPKLDLDIILGFTELWKIKKVFTSGHSKHGYIITPGEGENKSLHINLTTLVGLTGDEEFWELQELDEHLEFIDLLHNRFESLPQEVEGFATSLKVAGLAFNCFDSFPEPLLECRNLQTINLYKNQVRTVPKKIAQLHCLILLDLGDNKVKYLPNVFESLCNLEILLVEKNLLTVLPPSIANLPKLKRLGLADNFLKQFPSVVFYLQALEELTLANNRIQHVPGEAKLLVDRLQVLSLEGNPLQDIDPKLIQLDHLRRYLADMVNSTSTSNSTVLTSSSLLPHIKPQTKGFRILVLGECGSGKTSLVQVLCSKKYITPVKGDIHDHTVGIDRYKWYMECRGKSFDISVWDFAGEKTYSMMNQLFLSDKTLIWIAVNLKKRNYSHCILPWLKVIMSRSVVAKVWIVCTHSDQIGDKELRNARADIARIVRVECEDVLDFASEKLRQFQQAQVSPECSTNLQEVEHYKNLHQCAECLLESFNVLDVTNTYSMYGHPHLDEKVRQLVSSDGFNIHSQPLPEAWAEAELNLKEWAMEKITSGNPPILRMDQVVISLVPHLNEEECSELLKYLHQDGEVLLLSGKNFSPDIDMVVLDPSWLVSVLQTVFHHDFNKQLKDKEHITRLERWARQSGSHLTEGDISFVSEHLESTGLISGSLLCNLWYKAGVQREYFEFLMSILEKFGLAYRCESPPHAPSSPLPWYLFPWLLEENCHDDPCTYCQAVGQVLVIKYEFSLLPFGLFERFMVRVHCLPHIVPDSIGQHYISVRATTGDLLVHIHHRPNNDKTSSKIFLYCKSLSDSPLSAKSFWDVMKPFVQVLDNLITSLPCHGSSTYVQCPRGIERGSEPHFPFPLNTFFGLSSTDRPQVCPRCLRETGSGSVGSLLMIPRQVKVQEEPVDIFSEVHQVYNNANKPLSDSTLLRMAGYIIPWWKDLGCYLGLQEYDIQLIDSDQITEHQKAFAMLHQWTNKEPKASTSALLRTVHKAFSKDIFRRILGGILQIPDILHEESDSD